MNKQQWKRISHIFDVALTLPQDHRSTYIRELCADDRQLQEEMDQLLASLVESEGMLAEQLQKNEVLIDRFATHLEDTPPIKTDHLKGQIFGNWKLTDLLGQGGMGSVYKAERTQPEIRQTGALKILHRNLKTPENVSRFRLEQQILASLHHPNIASLIEGGVSEDGLPWMVMEYVEGQPLLEYCNTQCLSLRKRLNLFETICDAIEHAHKNLIVHRDLKPENILITPEGHVKILDFGIAKLLDPDLYDFPAVLTRPGSHLMSLEYAAPEQVTGKKVTTTTDIYALGILLYELLAGVHPFDLRNKKTSEIVEIIQKSEPTPPSRKLTASSAPAPIAKARSVQIKQLVKTLSGDLDAIILKAIRKEPGARYDSVGHLKEDVTLYLQNRPVTARNKVVQYRLKKYWKRHKTGVLATIAFFAVVAFLITFYTTRLAEERNMAQREAETAEQVSDFLVSLFEASRPGRGQGDAITARMLLERGIDRAENLDDQPIVQARMFEEIGRVYRSMGYYKQAEPLLKRAVAIRKDLYGENHPEVAKSLNQHGLLQKETGNYAAADSLYSLALAIQRESLGEAHPDIARSLNNLGVLHRIRGKYDIAESYLLESLQMWRSLFESEHPGTARTTQNLGALLMVQGNYEEAEKRLREALDMEIKLHGEYHPQTATVFLNLAHVLKEQKQYNAAEPFYRQALRIQRNVFEKDNSDVAQTLNNLAVLLMKKDQLNEAGKLLREATDIRRRELGENHKEYVASLHNLAFFYQKRGDFSAADSLYQITLKKWRKLLGPKHPNVAVTLNNLASVQKSLNHHETAEQNYQQALALRRNVLGDNHPTVKKSVERLVELYEAWDRPALAAAYRDTLSSFE